MSSYTYKWLGSCIVDRFGEPVEVTCELDYEPSEPQTINEPGHPESMTLEQAWVGDFDIQGVFDEATIREIQSLALVDSQDKEREAKLSFD